MMLANSFACFIRFEAHT